MKDIEQKLVAHRGYSKEYPENSCGGILAALLEGAAYVEFDVQLNADKVPYVVHDSNLKRTTGQEGLIHELTITELQQYKSSYAERFGEKYSQEPLPRLVDVVTLFDKWPQCQLFVEVKRASISRFGNQTVYQSIYSAIECIERQSVIISFDLDFVRYARLQGYPRIAWVFDQWDEDVKDRLFRLQPDYVFTDWECVPAEIEKLWSGAWQWVVYEIDDPELAQKWFAKGADLVETNDIAAMLKACRNTT